DYFINPFLELSRSITLWSNNGLGVPQYLPYVSFIHAFPAAILNSIINNAAVVSFMYFVTLFSLSGYFMYLLLRYFKIPQFAIWIGSIFFMLNPFVFMRYHTP